MKKWYIALTRRLSPLLYPVLLCCLVVVFIKSIQGYYQHTDGAIENDLIVVNTNDHIQRAAIGHHEKEEETALQDGNMQESKMAFLEAYKVFMHPRCMNCHPVGDVPLQGDDSHLHTQGVKRGIDGKGLYAMKCKNCHQDKPLNGPHLPPGFPVWHLPPANRKMVFEGKLASELASNFQDSKFTGFKSMEQFIEHVENDPLVKNSFTYGTKPPLTHSEFVAKVKEWIEKGAAIPDN